MTASPAPPAEPRGRNRRGQGERLREEIVESACRLLDELADDQALSLRAVARDIGIAATSVYLHFADRDALVLAALQRCHADQVAAIEAAEKAGGADPVARLRNRILLQGRWAHDHPGLYKVMHESTLNQRNTMAFKLDLAERAVASVQACIDAGLAPPGDASLIALDLRAAVHGTVSMRVNQPDLPWPPLEEQVDRYLTKLVGVSVG